MNEQKNIQILGINFFNAPLNDIFLSLKNNKGLITVPSGPGLATIPKERDYYNALIKSDLVIADSGYMVMIWNLISKRKIKKVSGLAFINYFLQHFKEVEESLFLINPTQEDQYANIELFNKLGVNITEEDCYLAPFYNGNIVDQKLQDILEAKKPQWILINLGGGVQEILGHYIRVNLSYKPAIICTGAAIAFKTGRQVHIPTWADKIFLGWFFRIISKPKVFIPRYLSAFKLFILLIKFKEKRVYSTD